MFEQHIPKGAKLLAAALLSQGRMTAPRCLVMYIHPRSTENEIIVHEVNLESGARHHGGYHQEDLAGAYRDFYTRLEADVAYHLSHGVPLTDPTEVLIA